MKKEREKQPKSWLCCGGSSKPKTSGHTKSKSKARGQKSTSRVLPNPYETRPEIRGHDGGKQRKVPPPRPPLPDTSKTKTAVTSKENKSARSRKYMNDRPTGPPPPPPTDHVPKPIPTRVAPPPPANSQRRDDHATRNSTRKGDDPLPSVPNIYLESKLRDNTKRPQNQYTPAPGSTAVTAGQGAADYASIGHHGHIDDTYLMSTKQNGHGSHIAEPIYANGPTRNNAIYENVPRRDTERDNATEPIYANVNKITRDKQSPRSGTHSTNPGAYMDMSFGGGTRDTIHPAAVESGIYENIVHYGGRRDSSVYIHPEEVELLHLPSPPPVPPTPSPLRHNMSISGSSRGTTIKSPATTTQSKPAPPPKPTAISIKPAPVGHERVTEPLYLDFDDIPGQSIPSPGPRTPGQLPSPATDDVYLELPGNTPYPDDPDDQDVYLDLREF